MSQKNDAEMAQELFNASFHLGDELGTYWRILGESYNTFMTCLPAAMKEAYVQEIRSEHKRLNSEFKYVEHTETRTFVTKELLHESEWDD